MLLLASYMRNLFVTVSLIKIKLRTIFFSHRNRTSLLRLAYSHSHTLALVMAELINEFAFTFTSKRKWKMAFPNGSLELSLKLRWYLL